MRRPLDGDEPAVRHAGGDAPGRGRSGWPRRTHQWRRAPAAVISPSRPGHRRWPAPRRRPRSRTDPHPAANAAARWRSPGRGPEIRARTSAAPNPRPMRGYRLRGPDRPLGPSLGVADLGPGRDDHGRGDPVRRVEQAVAARPLRRPNPRHRRSCPARRIASEPVESCPEPVEGPILSTMVSTAAARSAMVKGSCVVALRPCPGRSQPTTWNFPASRAAHDDQSAVTEVPIEGPPQAVGGRRPAGELRAVRSRSSLRFESLGLVQRGVDDGLRRAEVVRWDRPHRSVGGSRPDQAAFGQQIGHRALHGGGHRVGVHLETLDQFGGLDAAVTA